MSVRPFLVFFLLTALAISAAAQTRLDSLHRQLAGNLPDTLRAHLLNEVGLEVYSTQPDAAIAAWKQSCTLIDSVRGRATGATLGRLLTIKGDVLSNIAFVYMNRGMTKPALEYNFRSLRIRDSIQDKHGIAESLNNLAFEYCELGDTLNAIRYYELSASEYLLINDQGGVAFTLINRARIYGARRDDSLARRMYLPALEILSTMPEHHRGYSQCLNNLGNLEARTGNYELASNYIYQSIAVRTANKDNSGLADSYLSLAKLYNYQSGVDSALFWAKKGYALALSTQRSASVVSGAQLLSMLYENSGRADSALKYYRLYVEARDNVASEESGKQMVRSQLGYDYAKKSAEDSLNFINRQQVTELKLSRQRGFTIGGFSALGIVAVLLFFVYRQRNHIAVEKKRSDELLLNILPAETAEELKETGQAKTKKYGQVSVVFTDFKNFTQTAEQLAPEELVQMINFCYAEFDRIVTRHNVEKIKTIGDSYMCVGGLPVANKTHATDAVAAAIEMLEFVTKYNTERKAQGLPYFDIRIGIHTGAVVAGIVGIKKFAYDIWGDTVNIASRMESSSEPGRINISSTTYELVKGKYPCTYRGKILAKNKGEIDMYYVD